MNWNLKQIEREKGNLTPNPLTEPCLKLSPHTALLVRVTISG